MSGRKTMQISLKLVFVFLLALVVLADCRHDGLNVSTLKQVCYDTEIAPIFLNKCGSCHSATRSRGGFGFYDYNSIIQSVTPFNAQKSKAYQAITGKAFTQLMPPDGALSENERILIRVWIDQGAKNTICTVPVDNTRGKWFSNRSGWRTGMFFTRYPSCFTLLLRNYRLS